MKTNKPTHLHQDNQPTLLNSRTLPRPHDLHISIHPHDPHNRPSRHSRTDRNNPTPTNTAGRARLSLDNRVAAPHGRAPLSCRR